MALDGENTQPLSNDGSIADAVLHMPDFDELADPSPESTVDRQPRHPATQQWQEKPRQAQPPKKAAPEVEMGNDEDPGEVAETSEVAEEWFELPPEKEGEKPRRIKAEEVYQGYQEREQLRRELEEARQTQPPPEAYDEAINAAVLYTDKLVRTLQFYQQVLQPIEPDMDLLNERSDRYNPSAYHSQVERSRAQHARLQQVAEEIARHEAVRNQQQQALAKSQYIRERAKLMSLWPEMKDGNEALKVQSELVQHYGRHGVTWELIGSVHNAAFYALAKDALAYRRSKAAQETAAKVVRAKPKLVRGSARGGGDRQAQYASATQRLAKSNTVEDAADALGAILKF